MIKKLDNSEQTRRLRRELQQMTEVDDVSHHPSLLANISRECPNRVALVESIHPLRRYTCGMHAFGFVEKSEYSAIASRGFARIFAGGDFVHWLLRKGLLSEVDGNDASEGDIVIYFDENGRFKHAGLYFRNGTVVSKWGIGQLYRHAFSEVPESYGTSIRLFRPLPYEEAIELFRQFARDRGMLF